MKTNQRREQGRIKLGWEDVKEIIVRHFLDRGEIPVGAVDLRISAEKIWDQSEQRHYENNPTITIEFDSEWGEVFAEKPSEAEIKLENVTVNAKKLLESLRGQVNVLKTRSPDDEAHRAKLVAWIESRQYLERLVLILAGINPDLKEK
jgi:hypothetical protein